MFLRIAFILSIAIICTVSYPVIAEVPIIGDNSLFACVEKLNGQDQNDNFVCRGEIIWVSDGLKSKNGTKIKLNQAIRNLKVITKYFTKQLNKAQKQNDLELIDFYTHKLQTANDSFDSLEMCSSYSELCSETVQQIVDSCNVIGDPKGTDINMKPKLIVNGHECVNAVNSPIVVLRRIRPFCSGILIAPNIVLTAAHCIYDKDCSDPYFLIDNIAGVKRYVQSCIIHPQFTGIEPSSYAPLKKQINAVKNDIGLIS